MELLIDGGDVVEGFLIFGCRMYWNCSKSINATSYLDIPYLDISNISHHGVNCRTLGPADPYCTCRSYHFGTDLERIPKISSRLQHQQLATKAPSLLHLPNIRN